MLRAIFYARFHPKRGPSVIHQYPGDSIIASSASNGETLLNWSDISSYIIPAYELCNKTLSISANGCRVLGFPVSLEDAKYERNRFTFNVCFVLDEDDDQSGEVRAGEQVVTKAAAFFRAMEEEDGVLQAEERLDGLKWAGEEGYPVQHVGVLHTLLEAIMQDLNSYGETCIRIDDLHVLNLRLAPSNKPAPQKVRAWDVPLLIRSLPHRETWTWDLALQRVCEYIDGVRHVQRIAELADVEIKLVKRAIRELLYHERVVVLDVFHFQAIYALTANFAYFVKDENMLDECCKYIATESATNIFARSSQEATSTKRQASGIHTPAKQTFINLYRSLTPGLILHDFCLAHSVQLSNIDIRRLITFGVLKGFVRRIHKYALAIDSQPTPPQPPATLSRGSGGSKPRSNEDAVKEFDRAWKKAALSSGWATPPAELPLDGLGNVSSKTSKSAEEALAEEDLKLQKFLDGKHCLDGVCVKMHMSEKKIVERLWSGRFGDVLLFCK